MRPLAATLALLVLAALATGARAQSQSCGSTCNALDDIVMPKLYCSSADALAKNSLCARLAALEAALAALPAPAPPVSAGATYDPTADINALKNSVTALEAAVAADASTTSALSTQVAALQTSVASYSTNDAAITSALDTRITAVENSVPKGSILLLTSTYASTACPTGYKIDATLGEHYLALSNDGTKRGTVIGTVPSGATLSTNMFPSMSVSWACASGASTIVPGTSTSKTCPGSTPTQTQATVAPFVYVLACVKQ